LIIICLLSIYVASFYGCGKKEWSDSHNNEAELPEIVIGSDNYPPYNYVDTDGNATGIDVELATEAFKRMGYKARFIYIDWEDKKNLLADRTIDCAWGSFSMDGRENEYRWAGPYMISRQVVAVNMESDIYSLEDLEGKTIAVQTTTRPEKIFLSKTDERIPAIRSLIALQKRELIYPFLSKGYADALAAHETAICQYMEDYNIKFRILDEPLETVGLGVAFDKNDDRGIEKQLTEILNQMRNDGTEKKIISRYISDADKYLEVDSYGK
jgi:polar amino acid transport system substrate-binding protein